MKPITQRTYDRLLLIPWEMLTPIQVRLCDEFERQTIVAKLLKNAVKPNNQRRAA